MMSKEVPMKTVPAEILLERMEAEPLLEKP
jgi:hypothetical protein